MEDEPEKYQSHFSEYLKSGVEPDSMEEMYKKVHAAIRADPTQKKSEKQPPKEHKRYDQYSGFVDLNLSAQFQSPSVALCFLL